MAPMPIETPVDVFFDQLKDLKSATEQTMRTLPQLAGAASDPDLRGAFEAYGAEMKSCLQEILAIFDARSEEPGDALCKAMAGLIEGGNHYLGTAENALVRDHLLIAHGNRIGHYLQAASEFTRAIAEKCGWMAETDAAAGMLARHREFKARLARVGASAFDIRMGGNP